MDNERMICNECSMEMDKEELVEHDGEYYCSLCYENKFITCHKCGETIEKDDAETYGEDSYCNDCFHDTFTSCRDCGETFYNDDITYSEGGDSFCQDCYDERYISCEGCSEEVYRDDSYTDYRGRHYCSDCYYDRYTTCDECDEEIHQGDARYDEDSGNTYCQSCYDEICGDSTNKSLRDYSFKPSPTFYGKGDYHLGIELEVEGDYDYIQDDVDHEHLYYKRDGSLDDGFEIVSHPMTYKYIVNNKIFENVLKICRDKGYKSHDTSTCGMHVHISKDLFTSLHLFKLLKLVYENEELFLKLAQRKKEQADQWASFRDCSLSTLKQASKEKYKDGRYEAINLSPRKTIEFRFMKGNLLNERFNKNLELVLSAINFSKSTSISKVSKEEYLEYVFRNEKMYKNLVEFCKLKEIGYTKQLPALVEA